MVSRSTLEKGWSLLDAQERRTAAKLLLLMVTAALASAVMVGSIFPFLSVLSDPTLIGKTPWLHWVYEVGGFTSSYTFLVALGIVAIFVIVISNIILALNTWAVVHFTSMRKHAISRRLIAHYLAQPYEFFLGRHSGDLSSNILSESQQLVDKFLHPAAELVSASLTILAVLGTLLWVEPVVASLTIVIFGVVYGATLAIARRSVKVMGIRRAQANEQCYRHVSEAFGGIKEVKLLGREGDYLERFSGPSTTVARTQIGAGILSSTPRYAIQVVAFGGIILLCLLLLDPEGLEQREALGGLLPFLGLLAFAGQRLLPELGKLYTSLTLMGFSAAAVDRVYQDLGRRNAGVSPQWTLPEPLGLRHKLELDGIGYAYPGETELALRDISLEISVGERVGIVGSSGAGKTTLVDVILGLLPPSHGTIFVDGIPIEEGSLRAWQQSVGYVPQDIFLTDASLAENIALGVAPEAIDRVKVEQSARMAQLDDFIHRELPNGYNTVIGERGVRLSGGQRQRIGIARALYHDADLIVFDEATSALDNLTERDVMAAIEHLPGDKTVLVIAHRLSTVKVCNRIIMLDGGLLEADGSWEDLLASNASFQALAGAR